MFDNLLSVLWIARYDYESGWKLKNHKHSFYQIVYIIDGKGYFLINNKIYDILPTRVFIIKPGQIHNIENNSKLIIKTLDIKFDVFDSRIKKILQNMDNFMGTDQSKIRTFLEEIKDEGNTKGVFYKEYSALYLLQLIIYLCRRNKNYNDNSASKIQNIKCIITGEHDDICQNIIDYVGKNYSNDIKLEDLARFLKYNKCYICQRFKRVCNCTIMYYIYKFRIEKSKELITYSDYNLEQISLMVGFKSIHHFTRLFHKYVGITPGQFRNKEKEGIRKDIYINEKFKNKIYL